MAAAAVSYPSQIPDPNSHFREESRPVVAREANKPVKHDVHTTLNFHLPNADGSPPAPSYVAKPETYDRPVDTHDVVIRDVTGDEAKYSLDSHGFQFVPHVSREKVFLDDDQIQDGYYKEIDQILKDATGATRTFIFDHTIRRDTKDARPSLTASGEPSDNKVRGPIRGPVLRVHIDQSYSAAASRVPFHLPEDAARLSRGRVQIINVWRPIKTVKRDPLAVARAQSVPEEDLVPVGLIYPNRKGETLGLRYNPQHEWYYKWHQTPEEVLLIKCFDNRAGVESPAEFAERAKRVPHSAFEIPGAEGEEARESIEVRCLVFHEDE